MATARVVVADIDTGINAYHIAFRDNGPDAYVHPSNYIPGFPADVPALNLTLDADSYLGAVAADCDVWNSVEVGQLYWIPGTRIIGARTTDDYADAACTEADLPARILDQGGHGTMTAGRIAGEEYSMCPTCKIVFLQGFNAENMVWAAEQGWIDLQTNSWGDLPHSYAADKLGVSVLGGNDREAILQAAKLHPIFVAGGNGLGGFFGVTGHPGYFDNVAGTIGIVMIGGHDNGYYTPWTMTMPHVVADANRHPSVLRHSIDEGSETVGGGTSGATPFAAGTFAQAILQSRIAACDYNTGVRDGNLVWGGPDCILPESGPLADGFLSVDEAIMTYYHTAKARPVQDGWFDGPACIADDCLGLYTTAPVAWADVPATVPAYYYVGYGQVGNVTLADHMAVLMGTSDEPLRDTEDIFFGLDNMVRDSLEIV